MSLKSAPCYWLECDEPGCGVVCPDGEVTAYSSPSHPGEVAADSDWLVLHTFQFCHIHANDHCGECGASLTGAEQDRGEYECFTCTPEFRETAQ